jgi:uncharacterized protein (TIGR03382 family)
MAYRLRLSSLEMLKNAAVVLVTTLCAAPALACSWSIPDATGWTYAFEGAQVPQNAEFRAVGGTRTTSLSMTFDGAGGPIAAAAFVDEISALIVPATPLTPGAWTLTIEPNATSDEPRVVSFSVVEAVDNTPPVIDDARAAIRTVGDLFADPDSCSGGQHKQLDVGATAANNDTPALVMVVGESERGVFHGADAAVSFSITNDAVETVDVVIIDFAGNVSEPVTVEVAGGCSSSSMPLTLPLALGLLARRRRR